MLSDDFGQRVRAIYKHYKNENPDGEQYPIPFELIQYTTGVRPTRGRDWSGVKRFLVPLNCNGSHWILLSINVQEWTIWVVYDSKPGCASIETEVMPLRNYFPYLLWLSNKFQEYRNQVKNPLRILYSDRLTVPRLTKS